MSVNYEYYRIFYYVAKYRNLTQAAAALFSSQPNITRVMNHLEHELGCQLMLRTNKGISLTAEGEQLYSHVSVAFEQLQAGEAELLKSVALQSGTVSIGASETALHLWLLERLRLFRREYPGIGLKIYNYNTPQALKALRNGQIDFAVVTTPAELSLPFKEVRLKPFQDILLGGTAYKSYSEETHTLRELSSCPLVCLGRNTNTYELYNRFYLDCGLVMEPDIEVATADLVLPMIVNNLGVGFLPREFAAQALAEKQVFELRLLERIPERCVCAVYDEKRVMSIAAKEWIKIMELSPAPS